jgi:VIT1/CCC1 family predicted Fe2+/Mn2+ transporter
MQPSHPEQPAAQVPRVRTHPARFTPEQIRAHREQHFTGSLTVRDIVIGMSDGLTVPFALAAGLSGAVATPFLVVIAGIAEMAAGSIAMGLGGYLASRSESETFGSELAREQREIAEVPELERYEVREILEQYGLTGQTLEDATDQIVSKPERWVDFMMREELRLEEPEPGRARQSAITIGLSYIAGGIIPLFPYVLPVTVAQALLIALAVFGAVKARFTGVSIVRSAIQTTLVGGAAAAAAYLLARLVSSFGGTVG